MRNEQHFKGLFSLFLQLGKMLGFTFIEIEQAYFQKNDVNYQRQQNGY
ncbi:MAG: dUTP diphosphatase [Bacillota bacterium]|nr:dUTP diphosphatase [Bacillota bacterium]